MERRSSEPTHNFDPDALLRLRRERGLSHDALTEIVSMSRPDLIAYEKGRKRPGVDRLAVLAKGLNVDPWALTTADPSAPTLADLRVRAGLTRSALAETLGMPRGTWDAIERGRRELRPEIATQAAQAIQQATRHLQPIGTTRISVSATEVQNARRQHLD